MRESGEDGLSDVQEKIFLEYIELGVPIVPLALLFRVPTFRLYHYRRKVLADRGEEQTYQERRDFLTLISIYMRLKIKEEKNRYDHQLLRILYSKLIACLDFPRGVFVEILTKPAPDPYAGYQLLLKAAFRNSFNDWGEYSVDGEIEKMFAEVEKGELECKTAKEFSRVLKTRLFMRLRQGDFDTSLDSHNVEVIEQVLVGLDTEQQQFVLRHRFGLGKGWKPKTLDEIRNHPEWKWPGRSRERIRQIEAKSLRLLRRPERSEYLKNLIGMGLHQRFDLLREEWKKIRDERDEAVLIAEKVQKDMTSSLVYQNLLHEKELLEQEVVRLRPFAPQHLELGQLREFLERNIEELNISIRAYNCLKHADCNTIYDIVTKTEHELLKIKNMGYKTRKEIQEVLGELGLTLGMSFDQAKAE